MCYVCLAREPGLYGKGRGGGRGEGEEGERGRKGRGRGRGEEEGEGVPLSPQHASLYLVLTHRN